MSNGRSIEPVVALGSNGVAGGIPAELSGLSPGPVLDFGSLIPGAD